MTATSHRTADYQISDIFLERWSPRAFSPVEIGRDELFSLFEAARWAPSAFNAQPWQFIYARRGDAHWDSFVGLLNPFNAGWAKEASALVAVFSKTTLQAKQDAPETANYSHSFDAGAAWACLALQASQLGWQAHGMAGFDHERAVQELGVPPNYRPEAMIAIGRPGDKATLSEALQARETPSQRDPIISRVFEGTFGG